VSNFNNKNNNNNNDDDIFFQHKSIIKTKSENEKNKFFFPYIFPFFDME
jgi:hypothetical protein